jgi:AMMECR1 domain-containing protein
MMQKSVPPLRYPLCGRLTLVTALLVAACAASAVPDHKALIDLARRAVRSEVEGKPLPSAGTRTPVKPVFVTIETKGKVVGCRGGLDSRSASLEKEIVLVARAAASHDPRYHPLGPKDLKDFQVTITVVQGVEPLDRIESLSPADGLVLRSGSRSGVVLPWEGKDPKTRLKWAYRKAGVSPGTPCTLHRMKAERFRG